jgi:ADP-heptose:LPS heptosyltransferase
VSGNKLRRLLRWLKIVAYLSLDSLLCIPVRRKPLVLIVRLDGIGDFFLWLQSGAVDITRFAAEGHGRTVLLANQAWSDYARGLGVWDEVLDLQPERFISSLTYRLFHMARIRLLGAALLIQPRAARLLLQEDAIARVSGAICKIGTTGTIVNTDLLMKKWGDSFYDRLLAVSQDRALHETVRNEQFVTGLTGKASRRFTLPEARHAPDAARIVVALGAGWKGRVWPVEKLASLLRHIVEKRQTPEIVLLGTIGDRELGARLNALVGGGLISKVGDTTLAQYVELIASAGMVICNDSSAYHIAMALSRKTICFLGGGHYGWFAPYPQPAGAADNARVLSVPMDCFWCNWHCRFPRSVDGAVRCVGAISVESAIGAYEALSQNP